GPESVLFEPVVAALEAHVPNVKSASSLDMSSGNKVVEVGMVAQSPEDPGSRWSGFGFRSELHLPLAALVVGNVYFLGSARLDAVDKREFSARVRRPLGAAGAVEQIAAFDVRRLLPQDGRWVCGRICVLILLALVLLVLLVLLIF